jgi:hypothetical protein
MIRNNFTNKKIYLNYYINAKKKMEDCGCIDKLIGKLMIKFEI